MELLGTILLLLALGIVVATVWAIASGLGQARNAKSLEEQYRNLSEFSPADVYVSAFNLAGIAIDPARQEIALGDASGIRLLAPESIVSCEIVQDDVQIAYANRGSQAVGVVAGGLLLGGVGAVIGGLSGSTRSANNVHKVVLRLLIDDFDKPKHDIVLVDWSHEKKGLEKRNVIYRTALESAEIWHARVMAMMKAVDAAAPTHARSTTLK